MGPREIPSGHSGHINDTTNHNSIDMKQNRNNNYKQNQITRRLRRMEDKIDIILSDLNSIHIRLLTIERQQREDFTDSTINKLQAAAHQMKDMASKELQAVGERYGTPGI